MNAASQTTDEEGRFWIEFAPPFTDKLSKLKEFVDEHDLLGGLDKKYLRQFLGHLDEKELSVTKFKAGVKSEKRIQQWKLSFTINNRKDFEGEAEDFAEAFLAMAENFEAYLINAEMS